MLEDPGSTQTVQVTVADNPYIHLYADPVLLRQAIVKLIGNARKFAPLGTPVAVRDQIKADGSYSIAVRDSGPGIPREAIPKVTEPCFQIDQELSRRHEGSGLGLYLVRSFIELHGGRFELDGGAGSIKATLILPSERVAVGHERPCGSALLDVQQNTQGVFRNRAILNVFVTANNGQPPCCGVQNL